MPLDLPLPTIPPRHFHPAPHRPPAFAPIARNHTPLLPPSASAWIRRTLAESLRSRSPYAVNLLLAGYDTTLSSPHLYWIDYLGTKAVVPYAAHGLGMYVALSTMDKWWYPEMGRTEGVQVLRRCIDEVGKRELHLSFEKVEEGETPEC